MNIIVKAEYLEQERIGYVMMNIIVKAEYLEQVEQERIG